MMQEFPVWSRHLLGSLVGRTLNLLVMAVVGEGTLGWMGVDGGTSDGGIEALDR